ncbi:MAG: DUF2752 domain-containing protein [Thainema sp.]
MKALVQSDLTPSDLTRSEQMQRWGYFAIALTPLVGSAIFNLGLRLSFLGCPLMRYVGIPCPGWGLTRSFMAVARGDLAQAVSHHLFGPVLFVGFAIATLHLVTELIRNQKIPVFYGPTLRNPKFQIFCFLVLVGYHGVRLNQLWQSGELYHSILQSPWGQWLISVSAILPN